jgi:ubiquitin-like 1-activating enzyme E1 B
VCETAFHVLTLRKLFGDDSEAEQALESGENEDPEELQKLKAEELELKHLRAQVTDPEFAKHIFTKIFEKDVKRLLQVPDMWKDRHVPTPLSVGEMEKLADTTATTGLELDHQVWSLRRCYDVFARTVKTLGQRAQTETLDFDKDDIDMLDFVTSCTNLRAHVFGIARKTRFDIKEMAGNIIPAIATTNAIVAGLVVLMAGKILKGKSEEVRTTYLSYTQANRYLLNETSSKPSPTCGVCSMAFRSVAVDLNRTTLQAIVDLAQQELELGDEITIVDNADRMLYDFDFDDNLGRTLASLSLKIGSSLILSAESSDDDDEVKQSVYLMLVHDETVGETLASEGDEVKMVKANRKRPLEQDQPNDEIVMGDGTDDVILVA